MSGPMETRHSDDAIIGKLFKDEYDALICCGSRLSGEESKRCEINFE